MAITTNEEIVGALKSKFPEHSWPFQESYDMLTVEAPANDIVEVLRYLRDEEKLNYHFLTDLCGIHVPADPGREFGVIYHLHNWHENRRIRVKAFLADGHEQIDTATVLWSGANWMERETYDFYGIIFKGHPNLRKILNMEDQDYFPMRKQYPLEDATREDKEDSFFGR